MRTQPATNQISSQHKPNKLATSSTMEQNCIACCMCYMAKDIKADQRNDIKAQAKLTSTGERSNHFGVLLFIKLLQRNSLLKEKSANMQFSHWSQPQTSSVPTTPDTAFPDMGCQANNSVYANVLQNKKPSLHLKDNHEWMNYILYKLYKSSSTFELYTEIVTNFLLSSIIFFFKSNKFFNAYWYDNCQYIQKNIFLWI